MLKFKHMLLSFCLLLYGYVSLPATEIPEQTQPGISDGKPLTTSGEKIFSRNNHFAQELSLILPAFNRNDDIFSPGMGGSLIFETYALNRLFRGASTLPGIVIGITGSMLIYLPAIEEISILKSSAVFLPGGYLGFQFFFPLGDLALSPALYIGGKYYFSFHPGVQTAPAMNPVIVTGVNINFILNRTLNLAPVIEYQFYYDGPNRSPAQTMQFGLRTGFLF